jgi:hypothetical protein
LEIFRLGKWFVWSPQSAFMAAAMPALVKTEIAATRDLMV